MRISKALLCVTLLFVIAPAAYATEAVNADDVALVRRLELARQIQEHKSSKTDINEAIEQYLVNVPPAKRSLYRAALQGSLNAKALDKISIDAYVEVFTEKELEIMLDYYSKPEAEEIAKKTRDYASKVYPEIIRMLDRAMMHIKTGGVQ